MEKKERDILIKIVIMGLSKNLALEKLAEIYKDDPR